MALLLSSSYYGWYLRESAAYNTALTATQKLEGLASKSVFLFTFAFCLSGMNRPFLHLYITLQPLANLL
jgi:hypothetical protein